MFKNANAFFYRLLVGVKGLRWQTRILKVLLEIYVSCRFNTQALKSSLTSFCVWLWSITLCNFLPIFFSFLVEFFWNIVKLGGKKILQTIEQQIQFSYLLPKTENFADQFFFWISRRKEEFPRDYLINIVSCLFAYHQKIDI